MGAALVTRVIEPGKQRAAFMFRDHRTATMTLWYFELF